MLRHLMLPVLLVVLLGAVHVLPERGKVAESAVRMDLPLNIGEWHGKKTPVSQQEHDILAKDTEFAKVDYFRNNGIRPLPGGRPDFDRISASVVLSGYDINNSIHRPERCLPAQGHTIYSSTDLVIDLPNGRKLPVRPEGDFDPLPVLEAMGELGLRHLEAACSRKTPRGNPACVLVHGDFLPGHPGEEAIVMALALSFTETGFKKAGEKYAPANVVVLGNGRLLDEGEVEAFLDSIQSGDFALAPVKMKGLDVNGRILIIMP